MRIDLTTPPEALRLTVNDVDRTSESGGRVTLIADNSDPAKPANTEGVDLLSEDMKITQITVLINYRKSGPMKDWPREGTDEQKQRRFAMRIWELPGDQAPSSEAPGSA